VLVVAAALLIVLGWILIYANAHGRSLRLPGWVAALQVRYYLFLMNRLYLDALALRINQRSARGAAWVNTSKLFPYVLGLAAVVALFSVSSLPTDLSMAKLIQFLVVALMLPLFPFHGLYVAAVVRSPAYLAIGLTFLMPTAGLYAMTELLGGVPVEFLPGIRLLALFGALYGSLKALAEPRAMPLWAYTGVAFYAIFWWHVAGIGTVSTQGIVFAAAVIIITGGFLLATSYLQQRYGAEAVDRIGGLAAPMPRFAIVMALLTMAAVGLPPFGLFSGYVGILLRPPVDISWELIIIVFSQFAACFYLFKRMQRILFGPYRMDIPYEDLRSSESVALWIVLLVLVILGLVPYGFFRVDPLGTMEMMVSWLN
jgi:NADH-quinone oxidoreductase subunit M